MMRNISGSKRLNTRGTSGGAFERDALRVLEWSTPCEHVTQRPPLSQNYETDADVWLILIVV